MKLIIFWIAMSRMSEWMREWASEDGRGGMSEETDAERKP